MKNKLFTIKTMARYLLKGKKQKPIKENGYYTQDELEGWRAMYVITIIGDDTIKQFRPDEPIRLKERKKNADRTNKPNDTSGSSTKPERKLASSNW